MNERDLFLAALQKDEARAAFLAEACGDDAVCALGSSDCCCISG